MQIAIVSAENADKDLERCDTSDRILFMLMIESPYRDPFHQLADYYSRSVSIDYTDIY
jgi:hypothetical protein